MRVEGWESRLITVLEAARHEPYQLGTHDCFSVACAVVYALTGVDHWPQWAGTYRTRREALVRIAKYGGNFDDAASKLFGTEPIDVRLAQRGDILKYVTDGEPHLGVCNGASVAVLSEAGLLFVKPRACDLAWKIG